MKPRLSNAMESWSAFLDSVKKVTEDTIAQRDVQSPRDEALIVRNVARMMRQALDWEMECADPHLPRLSSWEVMAMSGAPPEPNLDSPYSLIRLDPKATYRLSGSTEGLLDVNVSLRRGFPPNSFGVFGDLGFKGMDVKEDAWEIHIAPREIPGKKTHLFPASESGDVMHIFLRLYWVDWSNYRRPLVEIECLDPPAASRPVDFSPALLQQQLKAAADYLEMRSPFQHTSTEVLLEATKTKPGAVPGGNSNVNYGGIRYMIDADEAMLIEFARPAARYWSVQISDGLVYDAFDFFRNITIRNNITSYVTPDNRVQIILAHTDPGVRNWIDTAGDPRGLVFYRWVWAEGFSPVPDMKVVKHADLPKLLHTATPRFSAGERQDELKRHRRKMAHHFFW